MLRTFQREIDGKTLTIETGLFAGQANGAVTLRLGDTVVLVTATMAAPREGIDFFPLTIEFEERLYAAGKIPGSFFRREGRPGQEAILSARLTDRPIRPLFPKGFRNEIQIICTVFSADQENPADILSIIGASAALGISDIPFEGPLSGCRVAAIKGELVVNPTFVEMQTAELELVVAGTREAVVMVEANAKEADEELVIRAVKRGQEANQEVVALIEEMIKAVGKTKVEVVRPTLDPAVVDAMSAQLGSRLEDVVFSGGEKGERSAKSDALLEEAVEALGERFPHNQLRQAFEERVKFEFRQGVLRRSARPDGRGFRDIRPLSAQVGLLPRTHGTGLFSRGQTQVLSIATLGSLGEEQRLDSLIPEDTKRYIHHYNFTPFSTGEVKRVGSPGRREVGHGALAERALLPMIPGKEEFPYTIRVVSEVLSANGSTSMASVCGSTLALMDAGVPIKSPVAGIAMGLIMGEDGQHVVLTDIQGLEDHIGDMDFKVAGSAHGVTALQMDIKTMGITYGIMEQALQQAREARLAILDVMLEAIPTVRPEMSPYAPRVLRMKIPVDKIGAVIGPGGKTIRAIIEESKATIDVGNDGTVLIGSPNGEALELAKARVLSLTQEVEIGAVYMAKVTRITSFGAFVEIMPGKEGLVRSGDLTDQRMESSQSAVVVGDQFQVMVIEIDRMGRINLSRRAVPTGETPQANGGGEERIPQPPGSSTTPPLAKPGMERGGFRSGHGGQPGRGPGPGFGGGRR
jgi:polyribonucleotide nucleotidyltransferase